MVIKTQIFNPAKERGVPGGQLTEIHHVDEKQDKGEGRRRENLSEAPGYSYAWSFLLLNFQLRKAFLEASA